MQPKEKIVRAVWNCYEGTKDCVINNVVTLISQGKLKISTEESQYLLSVLASSINEGFQKSAKTLENQISFVIDDATQQVRVSKKN